MILIPDLHGRSFWKEAVATAEADTRIIFLGDYTDPYGFEKITGQEALANFVEVVDYARNHSNVELLLGNHDCGYIFGKTICCCRRDHDRSSKIRLSFLDNIDLFKFCTDVSINVKKYIISHAGINHHWLTRHSDELFYHGKTSYNPSVICKRINAFFLHPDRSPGFNEELALAEVSRHRGGDDLFGSIVWADIDEFSGQHAHIPVNQIVGHTLQVFWAFDENGYSIYYGGANIKKGQGSTVYCIDTAEAYYLDEKGVLRYMKNDKAAEDQQEEY